MKRFLLSLIALTVFSTAITAAQCAPKKGEIVKSKSRFWTWVGYSDKRDWNAYFAELKEIGMDGILISSGREGLEKIIPIAKNYGIEVQAWLWVMNNGGLANEHPEWLDYNALGHSLKDSMAYVGYYKFLNPIIPGVRQKIAAYFEDLSTVQGLGGISLDYCRYVDAILPETLWGGYGIVQDKVYPKWDYGYHPMMVEAFTKKYGYDPREKLDTTPGAASIDDKKWLDFRCDVLNSLVDSIATLVHNNGKLLTASPFPTPEMSKEMVRQNWGEWKLDMAFPMIYHGFYKENGETAGAEWVAQCVKDCRRDMNKKGRLFLGMHIPDFNNPKGPSMREVVKAAMDNGAEGFSMYTFDALSAEKKAELKQIITDIKNKTL